VRAAVRILRCARPAGRHLPAPASPAVGAHGGDGREGDPPGRAVSLGGRLLRMWRRRPPGVAPSSHARRRSGWSSWPPQSRLTPSANLTGHAGWTQRPGVTGRAGQAAALSSSSAQDRWRLRW
jgi:hypothetical protein